MALVNYFGNAVRTSGGMQKAIGDSRLSGGKAVGTASNDGFSVTPGSTLVGGLGDDKYWQVNGKTTIVEKAGEGIDTVYVTDNYVMPDNVENLVVGYAKGVVGNALDNYIIGSTGNQSIDGGRGNDVLTGKGGGDIYIFGDRSGYDLITDFRAGGGSYNANPDTVQLAGYTKFKTFADVKTALSQVGDDTVLTLSSTDAVKFANTKIADFTASNFLLANAPTTGTLTFADEFNSLSLRDVKKGVGTWRTDYTWGGSTDAVMSRTLGMFNGEKQIYVDAGMKGAGKTALGINPFSIDDGILTIHADLTPASALASLYGYKYTSGLLTTKDSFTQTYGYFEASMDIPQGKGLWPAFWLYGATGKAPSEIDVMENWGGDEVVTTAHSFTSGKRDVSTATVFQPNLSEGFHKYGLLWTKDTITWYLDGAAVKSIATPADMHGPMYMLVNLGIDKTIDPTITSADLKVDYVHAYGLDSLPAYLTSPNMVTVAPDVATTTPETPVTAAPPATSTPQPATPQPATPVATPQPAEPVKPQPAAPVATPEPATPQPTAPVTSPQPSVPVVGSQPSIPVAETPSAPTIVGSAKANVFRISDSATRIVELANGGTDLVMSSVDYALPVNVERLTLTGNAISATGNEQSNFLVGNAKENVLIGLAGNDSLDGAAGADRMIGGTGDDWYTVDNAGDTVVELAGEGRDTVRASIDYTVTANVEDLILTGSAIRGTGNDLDNGLTGNDRDNILSGGAGNDNLNGGAGKDVLIGGTGSDTYRVDNRGDIVTELADEGTDSIYASVDYTLPANVERLFLQNNAVVGTGNDLNNSITGNSRDNILSGGDGRDIIGGGSGNDRLIGGAGNDVLTGGSGKDVYVMEKNGGADTVTDFKLGEDKIDWTAFTGQKAELKDVGGNVTITFGETSMTLLGIHASDVAAQHLFG